MPRMISKVPKVLMHSCEALMVADETDHFAGKASAEHEPTKTFHSS